MSEIDDLPPLREVIRRYDLGARKALGQNFLLDLNLTGRIARAAGDLDGRTVVEVGPGPGGLTRALLARGAKVIAIERDPRCLPALGDISARYPGRLQVIEGDALATDIRPHIGNEPARIVANLPYNVATPLLIGWLSTEPWPPWYESLTLMFQREVAERIVAAPGSKAYGRLAVIAQWRTMPKLMFDVARTAFVPPPNVTSSVVHFVPRRDPYPCSRLALERVTAAAFGQRRKMLRSSLKSLGRDVDALCRHANVEATARAEDVPVEGFARMAAALDQGEI